MARNSPLYRLPQAKLTPSGLLQLEVDDGEVEVLTRDAVQLRIPQPIPVSASTSVSTTDGAIEASPLPLLAAAVPSGPWVDRDAGLICTLTTHRLVFFSNPSHNSKTKSSNTRPMACFLDLCMIQTATSSGLGYISSAKILLNTFSYGDVSVVFESANKARQDRDQMLSSMSTCLSRRAWLESARQKQKKAELAAKEKEQNRNKVGVDAIMSKDKQRHKDAKRISEDAFKSGDVDDLMLDARELVLVINKYVATLERRKKSDNCTSKDKAAVDEEEQQLTDLMSNMGMMSSLSKKSAGTLYHQHLARQLADFLRLKKDLISKEAGIITLPDAYCIFNRARGANLVSADDMNTAAILLKELGLGFSKRVFPSGVAVIQSDEYDEKAVAQRLIQLLSSKSTQENNNVGGFVGITALDVSQEWNISALLAKEQLQSAERLGYMCRDAVLEGTRFFDNKFATIW